MIEGFFYNQRDMLGISHIKLTSECLAPGLFYLMGHTFKGAGKFRIGRKRFCQKHHLGTLRCKLQRDLAAYTSTCAGNKSSFIIKKPHMTTSLMHDSFEHHHTRRRNDENF